MCKKSNGKSVDKINIEVKRIVKKLEIDDRLQQFCKAKAFITLKDHKLRIGGRYFISKTPGHG